MTSEQLQAVADSLQTRADACIANGERQYASGLTEAVQAIRRLAPAPAKAPEPAPKAAEYEIPARAAPGAGLPPQEKKTPKRPWAKGV